MIDCLSAVGIIVVNRYIDSVNTMSAADHPLLISIRFKFFRALETFLVFLSPFSLLQAYIILIYQN